MHAGVSQNAKDHIPGTVTVRYFTFLMLTQERELTTHRTLCDTRARSRPCRRCLWDADGLMPDAMSAHARPNGCGTYQHCARLL